MTLQQFKARRVGAKKGFDLLKKKRDALKTRFQLMLREIVDAKHKVGALSSDCAFSMAKAKWAAGDVTQSVIQRVKRPSVTLKVSTENVSGVYLPIFNLTRDATKDVELLSLGTAQGGQVIQTCRQKHVEYLEAMVKLASLQTCFITLDAEIKMTSRRVNALDYVVLPRVESIIRYIGQEMDELEREEFYRVKKVVEKKRQRMLKERAAADALLTPDAELPKSSLDVGTAFDEVKKDADIVF